MRRTRVRRMDRRSRRGFTLMEVLLVLAILVILGTFAVMNFGKVFAGAKINAAEGQLNQFKTPLSLYLMDIGTLPDNNQGLQALRVAPPDLVDVTKWRGPYLDTDIPPDPWSNPYGYEQLGPNSYRLYSLGPDGQEGTDDDVVKLIEG